jgi:hypothetical protein
MEYLDRLLSALDHPPFDRVARVYVELTGALEGPPILSLDATTLAGNGLQESPKRNLERVLCAEPGDLEVRLDWVLAVSAQRRLAPPMIDEVYTARPLDYDGPLRTLGAELDCRLDAAKQLLAPQMLVEVAASLIPPERGYRGGCFVRARFQGGRLTPHIIEVKLFDGPLTSADDEKWTLLNMWARQSAGNHHCTVG